jgi:hypothetical protein
MATKRLPTKPQGNAAIEPPRGKGPTKGERAPAVKARKGARKKAPVEAATKRAAKAPAGRGAPPARGDQQPPRKRGRSAQRYVRLRVRVDDGDLSIVASRIVDGALAQPAALEGGYAYEVTAAGRLLYAGSIPDLGVVRSFAHPDGTLEQQRHHTYALTSYEFNARVPVGALKRAALPKTAVVLYRVKERPPARAAVAPLSAAPLGEQRARELREIGRVVGLPATVLGGGARTRAAKAPAKRAGKRPVRRRRAAKKTT